MTPQEQQLIDGLADRVRSTQATDKDADADRYLHQHLDGVPDALYVLAQTVLVQQYGLQNAQQQMQAEQQQTQELQEQVQALQQQLDQAQATRPQAQKPGSFLSHIFGGDNGPQQLPPQVSAYQPVNTGYGVPASAYGGPSYAPPVMAQPVGYGYGAGGGGFLRGALQTAAGVAAGEIMFQGMEDLFRGFGGEHRGYEGSGYDRPGETINNNYYGDQPGTEHHEAGTGDSSFYNAANDASRQDLSPDIEDRRGFAGTGFDSSSADTQGVADPSSADETGYDDAGSDEADTADSTSFDDGGSDDSSMGGDDGGF